MSFDGKNAKSFAEELSFPRLPGSDGERKAKDIIINHLENFGYAPQVEDFNFSCLPVEFFLKAGGLIIVLLNAFALLSFNAHRMPSLILAFLVVFMIIKSGGWSNFIESLYDIKFYNLKSCNILAKKVFNQDLPDVIFLAHYDSKSQTIPIGFRIFLTITGIFAVFVSILVILAGAILNFSLPSKVVFLLTSLSVFPFIILIFNFTRNDSPGAVDNASGAGLLLELARTLRDWQGGANIYFLFTGAEELGLAGAIRFIQKHESEFDKGKTFFINYDGIAGDGRPVITTRFGIPPTRTSRLLNSILKELFRKRGMRAKDAWLAAGAGLDSIPLGARGFETVTITWAGIKRSGRAVHSRFDTVSLLNDSSMKIIGDISLELLSEIVRK